MLSSINHASYEGNNQCRKIFITSITYQTYKNNETPQCNKYQRKEWYSLISQISAKKNVKSILQNCNKSK